LPKRGLAQIAIIFALVLVVIAGVAIVSYVAHLPPPGCSARCRHAVEVWVPFALAFTVGAAAGALAKRIVENRGTQSLLSVVVRRTYRHEVVRGEKDRSAAID